MALDESKRLHHLTLNTGDLTTPLLTSIEPNALRITADWLAEVRAAQGTILPLPHFGNEGYGAMAFSRDESLLMTVYGPDSAPLVTFGVAITSGRGCDEVWQSLQPYAPPQPKPLFPWCAVLVHPTLVLHKDSAEWLGDFERCVAVAFIKESIPEAR